MKHFYAKIDKTAKKENPGFGFANTKSAVAFKSKKDAIAFVDDRKSFDFSCTLIKRSEAVKYASNFYGMIPGVEIKVFKDNGINLEKGLVVITKENLEAVRYA